MHMTDALIRAFLSKAPTTDIEQVKFVIGRSPTEIAIEHIDMCHNLAIWRETLKRTQEHTHQDEQLQVVSEFIMNGWPELVKKISDDARDFFLFRETLSMQI